MKIVTETVRDWKGRYKVYFYEDAPKAERRYFGFLAFPMGSTDEHIIPTEEAFKKAWQKKKRSD